MFAFIDTQLSAPPLFLVLGGGYLVCGAVSAALLARRGATPAVIASSALCWPLFVSLLADGPRPVGAGPLSARIDACLDALGTTLRDPVAGELPGGDDILALRDALHAADRRIGLVDRLLGETDPAATGIIALRDARARSAGEIEAVLAAVVELRLQVGLLALAGDTAPVRDRLRELRGRIGALDEVTRITPVPTP